MHKYRQPEPSAVGEKLVCSSSQAEKNSGFHSSSTEPYEFLKLIDMGLIIAVYQFNLN